MDVTSYTFQAQLPKLLKAIAGSHFVAIDFELSGIASKQRQPGGSLGFDGNQTLQQRYIEIKEAAERYQILQVGLTCVEQDTQRGIVYISLTTGS